MVFLWIMRFYKCQRNPATDDSSMTVSLPGERVCFEVFTLSCLSMRLKSLSVSTHSSYVTPEGTGKDMPTKVFCPVCQVKKSQGPGVPPQLQNLQGEHGRYRLHLTHHELLTVQQIFSRPQWMKGLACVWVHIFTAWAKSAVTSHTCCSKGKVG